MGISIWVAGPVGILAVLALLSVLGLGQTEIITAGLNNATWGNINYRTWSDTTIYYDYHGNPKCYANLTAINEAGTVGDLPTLAAQSGYSFWRNATGFYQLYSDNTHTNALGIEDTGTTMQGPPTQGGFSMTIGNSLGLAVVISGIIVVGLIASVRVFGFGLSDVGINTLIKGGAYILIWAVFSGLTMNLLVAGGDLYSPLIYLGLTGVFAFGVMSEIGTPSNGGS